MSRCFPFPPPGYEKKPTTDEPDLLKKEKRKEKKHKKDKKDKEKRDGKEKREKDRSEGKHKEKKDKKDKHRDKKEKKSKSSSNPDEKKPYGQFEGYNGEKVHPNDSTRSSSSSDKKPFQNGEYHDYEHLQKKDESKNGSSDDKKPSMQFCGQNGEMVRNRSKGTTGTSENNKFVQELDRRIKDEEKGTGSSHQFAVDGRRNSFNRIEIQKTDVRQSIMDEAVVGRISNSTVQNKINGKTLLPPFDNKIEKRVEQKEKMSEKESDDKRGDKRKNKDRDKQRQGKDKDTEKEKKEEKAKEKSEQKRAEREKNKYIRKSESVPIPVPNNFSARPPENSFHGIGSEGSLKKRKDMESNGFSHETEPRPNKMGRFSSNIFPENGRKLDSVQNPGPSLLDNRQGASSQGASMNNFKVGSKGQRVNGMIDPQPPSVSSKTPPFSAFNHIPAKPSPIKSPPVITNHVAPQPPPVPTTKPQPVLPNHIAPKPPPSIPNHISARSPPLPSPPPPPPPPSTTAKQQPMSRPKPPPAVIKPPPPAPLPLPLPKKKPDPPLKPPHPDTKYLSQVLSVPKLEQWCGFDDQEWLFSKKDDYPCSKKTTTEEHQVQVWSEAKHIESVDVCALPYVIPY